MTSLFNYIDNKSNYLLLGDTVHYRPSGDAGLSIKANTLPEEFASSTDFLVSAADAGYGHMLLEESQEKQSLEMPHVCYIQSALRRCFKQDYSIRNIPAIRDALPRMLNDSAYLRNAPFFAGVCLSECLGIKFHYADPRSPKEKQELLQMAEQPTFQEAPGGASAFMARAIAKDNILTEFIRQKTLTGKSMTFYGAGHYVAGTPVERGIPVAQRSVVMLHPNMDFARMTLAKASLSNFRYPPDALHYMIDTDRMFRVTSGAWSSVAKRDPS